MTASQCAADLALALEAYARKPFAYRSVLRHLVRAYVVDIPVYVCRVPLPEVGIVFCASLSGDSSPVPLRALFDEVLSVPDAPLILDAPGVELLISADTLIDLENKSAEYIFP